MSDRSVTPPITADLAARVTPGPGTIVHRKPLTVVVSSEADADRIARGITEVVEHLIAAGDLSFGPVASGLQQFVVDHQPTGVAAVLDVAPDAIAFLFDQAVAIGDSTTHRASGRSGWTTVFVEGDSVSLVAGPGPERPVDPWSQLWAGTVAGQGVQVDLHRSSWSEPAGNQPIDSQPIHAADDIEPLDEVTAIADPVGTAASSIIDPVDAAPEAIAAAPAFDSFPLADLDMADREPQIDADLNLNPNAFDEADDAPSETEEANGHRPLDETADAAVDHFDDPIDQVPDEVPGATAPHADEAEDDDEPIIDVMADDGATADDAVTADDDVAEPDPVDETEHEPDQVEIAGEAEVDGAIAREADPVIDDLEDALTDDIGVPDPVASDAETEPEDVAEDLVGDIGHDADTNIGPTDSPADTDDVEAVIELEAEQIDLSSSSMPSWSWPPPVPEPVVGGPIETMASASTRARPAAAAQSPGVLDTPPAAPGVEPIAGPPPMPVGFPPPGQTADPAPPPASISAPSATPTATPAPVDAPPVPEDISPISGPPPMPGASANGDAPADLPPPPPGAEPIAGPPPMPGATARRADDDESG